MLEDLTLSRCTFTLQITQRVTLSEFTGSTLRGAFGTMFRSITCAQRQLQNCKDCYLQNACAYSIVFSTGNPPDSPVFPKNQHMPSPFLFSIKENKTEFLEGEEMNLELTLIGNAADYFPYFFIVLTELGQKGFGTRNNTTKQRGGFAIETITQKLPARDQVIYSRNAQGPMPPLEKIPIKELAAPVDSSHQLKVHYITPFRVKWQGRLCSQIDFHILLRNILRRLSTLYFLSNRTPLELDYKGLIQKAETVQTLDSQLIWKEYSRYSTRQQEKQYLGGVTGWALYQGQELPQFYPFLQVAELIAAGKGTTFGFGKIALEKGGSE